MYKNMNTPRKNIVSKICSTCLGAGPDGMCTIFDVTSTTFLLGDKFEVDLPFSGQRCSLTPEHGARFVTNIKWLFPFDP